VVFGKMVRTYGITGNRQDHYSFKIDKLNILTISSTGKSGAEAPHSKELRLSLECAALSAL